jgi:hypothetical protein
VSETSKLTLPSPDERQDALFTKRYDRVARLKEMVIQEFEAQDSLEIHLDNWHESDLYWIAPWLRMHGWTWREQELGRDPSDLPIQSRWVLCPIVREQKPSHREIFKELVNELAKSLR